jgi:hypothetical protein
MPPQPQSHGYCGTVCDVIPLGNVGDDAQSNRRAKFKVLRAPGATASRPPSRGSRVLSGRTLHILACINFSMKCLKITKRTPKCSHGAPPGVGSGVGLFQRTVHSRGAALFRSPCPGCSRNTGWTPQLHDTDSPSPGRRSEERDRLPRRVTVLASRP